MKLFSTLRAGIDALLSEREPEPARRAHRLELATAVLLLEISLADSEEQTAERDMIRRLLKEAFILDAQEMDALLAMAKDCREEATSLYEFTRSLNEALTPKDRVAIIEKLWRVAFADQVTDKYEEYYIRKIADLLYVSHADYIRAKHRAGDGRQ